MIIRDNAYISFFINSLQEATVNLLGKIGQINPALVLPRLRRVLAETITQLKVSGDGRYAPIIIIIRDIRSLTIIAHVFPPSCRLEQHSARIIALMANQSPKFMVPYMGQVLFVSIHLTIR